MKINLKLHPGSSQEKIENSEEGFEVWIKEKPIDGKANDSLLKFLRKYFKGKEIKIISGLKSRKKIIEVK